MCFPVCRTHIMSQKANADELSESLATCADLGIIVSATFYVFEIWRQTELLAGTENFDEMMMSVSKSHPSMQSLDAKVQGARASLLSVSSL